MLLNRRPVLVVPNKFNGNSSTVSSLMPAEQRGRWPLERMLRNLGLRSYKNLALLDFGCGVRFAQAILTCGFHSDAPRESIASTR